MSRSITKYDQYLKIEDNKRDLRGQAIRGGGVTILSRFLCQCLQIAGTMFLARMIVPGDFGLMAMVTTFTGFFMAFKDLGLSDTTIQRTEITHSQASTLYWITVGFSIVVTLIIIALSPVVAWFYNEPKLRMVATVSSISFLFAGMSTQQLALMNRKLQFMKIAVIEVMSLIISIFVAIILAKYGWGYWALVMRILILGMVVMIGVWIFCPWRPGLPKLDPEVFSIMKFGGNIQGYYFVNYFAKNMDNVLIGWRYGAHQLGFYEKAYNLSVAPTSQLSFPLYNVAIPVLSRLKSEPIKYKRYYLKSLSTLAFIGMPIGGFMSARSVDFINILLGPMWHETANIFAVLGMGIGMHILYATHGWLHVSLGRTDRWLRWGIVASALSVVAFVIGSNYGPMGVAIAYVIVIYILGVVGLWYAGVPIGLKVYDIISILWKYLFASLSAFFLCIPTMFIFENSLNYIIRMPVVFIYYIVIYILMLILLHLSFKPLTDFVEICKELISKKRNIPVNN